MLFTVVDLAWHPRTLFSLEIVVPKHTFSSYIMMLHRFSMGFKSGQNGGHNMTRAFLKPIFCRQLPVVLAACDGAVKHKNHFPFKWQRSGFEPRFEMFLKKATYATEVNFTLRNFTCANQLITHDPSPKHDSTSTVA